MNGLKAVEDMAVYLYKNQSVKVFKFEKTAKHSGEYIVVNHLPFIYSSAVNTSNVLNINIHVPSLSSGNADLRRLTEIFSTVNELIPNDSEQEEICGLCLDGAYYSISSVSQPIEDTDGTYFLNVKVKLVSNELKL